MSRRFLVLALALFLAMFAHVPVSSAKNVTVEGMRVNAPAGYKLTYANGVYTLGNKVRFVKLTYGRTPLALRPTASQINAGMKGKLSKVKAAKNGRSLTARITKGKAVYQLRLNRSGDVTTVQLFGRKAQRRASRVGSRATSIFGPIVTAGDILALNQILRSRRGARVIPFNLTVPTRRFQAPVQNGASALVPNLPGWQFSGTDTGYLTGGNTAQGAFELGGFIFVDNPQFATGTRAAGTFTTLEAAIAQVLPQHWRIASAGRTNVAVQQVVAVPGTTGILGPNFQSGMYQVRFTFNGRPWQGLFTAGASDCSGSFLAWCMYFSYISVPANPQGGIVQALMNTWSTWNNDAAVQAGLQRALNTVATTRVPGAAIDPAVFARTHQMWTEYIRS